MSTQKASISSASAAPIGQHALPTLFDRAPAAVGSTLEPINISTMHLFTRQLVTLREEIKSLHGEESIKVQHIDVVRGTFENVNEIGKAWIVHQVKPVEERTCEKFVTSLRTAFFTLKASGGKTPNFSETSTAPDEPDTVQNRGKNFKDDVLRRDGPYCAVRRTRDGTLARKFKELEHLSELPPRLGQANFEAAAICHLLPHALGKAGGEKIISFFARLTGLNLEEFCGVKIDSPENGMVLSGSIHALLQGAFSLGFEPTTTLHVYRVELDRETMELDDHSYLNGALADFSATHTVPPPSPQIMKALYAIFKISHANAAAEALLLPIWRFDAEEMLQGRTLGESGAAEEEERMVMTYLDARLAVQLRNEI